MHEDYLRSRNEGARIVRGGGEGPRVSRHGNSWKKKIQGVNGSIKCC